MHKRWDRSKPLPLVRSHCLDCCGGSKAGVIWCDHDGVRGPRCLLWRWRTGVTDEEIRRRWGPRLVTPQLMPPPGFPVHLLPKDLAEAATAAIDLPGYKQPEMIIGGERERWVTPQLQEMRVLALRLATRVRYGCEWKPGAGRGRRKRERIK